MTSGPYEERENINIKCEVLGSKGNISENDLQVYRGRTPMTGSTMQHNSDGTNRIFFQKHIVLQPSDHGTNITCLYNFTSGELQRSVEIYIISGE